MMKNIWVYGVGSVVGSILLSLGTTKELVLILGRMVRNPFCSNEPMPLSPFYKPCSPQLLAQKVTIVITVKDTCTQATLFLSHNDQMIPKRIPMIYVYPDFIGCETISLNASLFDKLTIKKTSFTASPIEGFLIVQPMIKTPYSLLTHNDAYVMDKYTICELMRALQAHTNAAFAAPQLYERSENGIAVAHAHHKNLHLHPVTEG